MVEDLCRCPVAQGALRWVLLEDVGKSVVRSDVPPSLVEEAFRWLKGLT